tara:strand:+ start:3093 stop:5528 length:2436 start_codon:yes stop_codon:yes gene_type:complete
MADGPKIAEAHVDIVANMEGLRADLAKVKSSLQKVQAPAAQATSKFAKLTAIFTGVSAVLNVVTFAFKAIGMVIGGISKLISGLATIVKTILVTAFNILKKIVTSVFGLIKGMISLAVAGFKRLAAFVGKSIKVQAEFGQSMARVGALTNTVGTRDFEVLRKKALSLGKATEFAAGEAADAMGNFAMAGFETNQIMQAVGPTLDFASANQLSLAESSDIAARVMGAMGVEASRTSDVMDALTIGATKTNQNVVDLGEAFKNAGSSASAAGVDLEGTTAALMVLADQGQRGSEAGSALKQVFLKMPSKNVTKMFGGLGIAMTTATGAMRPMPDLVDDLNSAIAGKGEFEKLNMLTEAFGTKAGPGMIKLLNAGGDAWRNYTEIVRNASGETKRIADIQRDTLATSFKIVASAADDLRIAVGDVFEPFIRDSNKRVVGVLNRVAEFIRENTAKIQQVIGDFLKWFEGVWKTAATVAIATMIFFWGELKAGWSTLKSWFSSAASGSAGFLTELLGLDKVPAGAGIVAKIFFAISTAFTKLIGGFDVLWVKLKLGFQNFFRNLVVDIKILALKVADAVEPFGSVDEEIRILEDARRQNMKSDSIIMESQVRMAQKRADEAVASAQENVRQQFAEPQGRGQRAQAQAEEIVSGVSSFVGGGEGSATADAPMTHDEAAQNAFEEVVRKEERFRASLRDIAARKAAQKSRADAKIAEDERVAAFLKNLPKRRAAQKREEQDKRREEVAAAGGVRQWQEQQDAAAAPATTSAVGAVGTISTVFGAMKVGVTEEVKLLGELVKLTKVIANSSATEGVILS